MSHLEHKKASPQSINCALITTSDSRTEENDESGKLLRQKLTEGGHKVVYYSILKNEVEAVKRTIEELLERGDVQAIITGGGTGVSRRDITFETVSRIIEKKLDGFGELFRSLSYREIGTASIMSRAVAGVINGKIIICIPGSLGAARLAADEIIVPEIGHMVREATR